MHERIGVRELRQHASRYLEKVKAGATVEITERGRLIAALSPPSAASSERERLVEAGVLIPAKRPFVVPTPARTAVRRTDAVLSQLRDERL